MLLSLVRSNADDALGFTSVDSRVCVALSRARLGFFCACNLPMLARGSELWSKLLQHTRREGRVSAGMPLLRPGMLREKERMAREQLPGPPPPPPPLSLLSANGARNGGSWSASHPPPPPPPDSSAYERNAVQRSQHITGTEAHHSLPPKPYRREHTKAQWPGFGTGSKPPYARRDLRQNHVRQALPVHSRSNRAR